MFLSSWFQGLKALDTFGNYQRPVFSLNWSSKLRDKNGREKKTPLSHKLCAFCFQMLEFRNLSWGLKFKLNSWVNFFSKTTLLQREPFLTLFYTINSYPFLTTKSVFKLTIILSNYQKCPAVPLKNKNTLLTGCRSWYSWTLKHKLTLQVYRKVLYLNNHNLTQYT